MSLDILPPSGGESGDSPIRQGMEKLKKEFHVLRGLERVISSFSFSGKLLLGALAFSTIVSAFAVILQINAETLVEVPARGGAHSEGVVGTPRFINPLLSFTEADRDLTALVYSGLLRNDPDGGLIPDLAESYSVSPDGKVYTVLLRDDATFHDGEAVTADDISFTVAKAQEPSIKSPRRANWEGVSVLKVSDREVRFTLRQPYAPFLENLTMGILPEHLWRSVENEQFPFSELNIEPVGSGPYTISSIERDSSRVPKSYTLRSFDDFALGEAHIRTFRLIFFRNESDLVEAYVRGDVDAVNSISPENIARMDGIGTLYESPLMRIFAVFFNQSQRDVFANKEVRAALEAAVDRDALITEALGGYGSAITGPLPPARIATAADSFPGSERITAAAEILERAGWKKNAESIYEKKVKKVTHTLSFSLATSNTGELKSAAEYLKSAWESLGARVELKIFEIGDLNQNVIRPRKFDSLLFGEIVGRELDLFAFWHSTQRNDPGLNVATYVNSAGDRLLEEARRATDASVRAQKFDAFVAEIQKDIPAVFLYTPSLLFATRDDVSGVRLGALSGASERFLNVHEWYTERDLVWSLFAKERAGANP